MSCQDIPSKYVLNLLGKVNERETEVLSACYMTTVTGNCRNKLNQFHNILGGGGGRQKIIIIIQGGDEI